MVVLLLILLMVASALFMRSGFDVVPHFLKYSLGSPLLFFLKHMPII